jgi:hypothetical protein
MVKLICSTSTANDDEQYKDNHININQYFESNKDRILNLGEKNYENLVKAFTKNAIDIAASASSSLNHTSSLLQSSPTSPNPLNQSYTYRIEESEIYDNSKGDIVE